jgi:hypothetical protein
MGILDEAIREHLDLKRLHGADDSDVKRLEDEAFGPPTRPGEPDFPESQEQPAVDDGTGGEGQGEPQAGEAGEAPEAATTLLKPEDAPPAVEEPKPEAEAAEAAPAPEAPGAVPEQPATEEAAEAPSTTPAEAEPEAPGGLFDHEAAELNLDDLDLDLSDEGAEDLVTESGLVEAEDEEPEPEGAAPASEEAPPSEEAPLPEEAPPPDEPPVSNLETVEHPMEEELGLEPPSEEQPATEEEPLSEEHPEAEEAEPGSEHEDEEGTGEGDVLEETPEFLQDRPEDDELWFEQGEPKDFDF